MTFRKAAKYFFIGACCGLWGIGTYIVVSNL